MNNGYQIEHKMVDRKVDRAMIHSILDKCMKDTGLEWRRGTKVCGSCKTRKELVLFKLKESRGTRHKKCMECCLTKKR